MNFREAYEFDPGTYGDQDSGLLGKLAAMVRVAKSGTGSDTTDGLEYDPQTYTGQQDGLLGRLLALQQQQAAYRPPATGASGGRGGLTDQIVGAESQGKPDAKNDRSSALGPGQFLSGTWLDMLSRHRPDLTGTPDQLLALRRDPQLAREMTEAYAKDNASQLSRAGHEATPRNIYLAHFAGATGAISVLNADPDASVRSVLGDTVIAQNPFLANMTIGDMRVWADRKMARKPNRPVAPMSAPFPERADPIYPGLVSEQPVRRLVRRGANDLSLP